MLMNFLYRSLYRPSSLPDHMPDYALATLRRLASSMRRSESTTLVSDLAGERLTDQIIKHGDQQGDGGSEAGSRGAREPRRRVAVQAATVPPAPQPSLLRRSASAGRDIARLPV